MSVDSAPESPRSGSRGSPVPDVVAPPPRHPRFPLSDGVRGVASTAIVAVHAWLFTGGFGGFGDTLANRLLVRLDGLVATFFLLSAFLLYRPMIAHRTGGPPSPQVGDYGRRRFLRIYPVYWVVLTCLAIVPGLVGVFTGNWWRFYSLAFYLDPFYDSATCPTDQLFRCGLPQTWTLTTEVTFYLILPLYAALTARLAKGRSSSEWMRAELVLLVALSLLSIFLNGAPLSLRTEPWFRFTFAGHFLWLALGLALAVLSVGLRNRHELPSSLDWVRRRPGASWLGALAVYLVLVATLPAIPFIVAPFSTPQFIDVYVGHALFATLLILPVVFGDPNRGVPARVLGNPAILWLGLISYSLYLWHVTIAFDLGSGGAGEGFGVVLALTLLIAVPLAALTYYLIERPLMRLKRRPLREVWGDRRRLRRAAGGR